MKLLNLLFRRQSVRRERPDSAAGAVSAARRGVIPVWPVSAPLAVSAVFRCVRLLSEAAASLPFRYLVRKGEVFREDEASELAYLLARQPDADLSAFDFMAQLVQQVLLEGNAYVVPCRSAITGRYERLALCRRGAVTHDIYTDTYSVSDPVAGLYGVFPEAEVIHVKGLSIDGKNGLSVLGYARHVIDIGTSGDAETLARFQNGGSVTGIVTNCRTGVVGMGQYQDEELARAAVDIDGDFRTGRRIVSIPGEVDFKQLSLSSADMQFLETRKFNVREICRFFGVPPTFVFDDTSNNYKSAEMASVDFYANSLGPLLKRIEAEFSRKLVPRADFASRRFEFDRRGIYATDLTTKVRYQMDTIQAGIYTINDWRAAENMPPVEGGDTLLVSANLKSIKELLNTSADGQEQNNQA